MAIPSMDERARTIERLLLERGRVSVDELARLFGTSPVTVRQDLTTLEADGKLRRVRGGAVRVSNGADGAAFDFRLRQQQDEKRSIAERAAELVSDGDALVLDCSTTTYHLARRLTHARRNLIVVTNGLRIAQVLSENPTITVIMPGGTVHATAQALVGGVPETLSGAGRLSKGFFGPWAVSAELGYLDVHAGEADFKRWMVEACDQLVALFDSSKSSHFAFIPFAQLSDVHVSVTDRGIPDQLTKALRKAGQEILLVDPEQQPASEDA
ncbi:DeoR/GlpR family DNA-binding transcription regulator [Actinopolymorpha alba]|uniref:DeoR/GlpR family DNA-binding transcription regulator n=1 Tax=Actinopolymorpha alba TaxID=533267 RepID=UPI0003827477|nr:DeoR/GlpR family DNA-binding transcription regulator [Actinopolymorpha alba]